MSDWTEHKEKEVPSYFDDFTKPKLVIPSDIAKLLDIVDDDNYIVQDRMPEYDLR